VLSRRRFLINGGALGAWAIAGELAGRIARLARESNQPYLVEIERPVVELWANCTADGYLFTLGCPGVGIKEPEWTWGEWLQLQDVDISSREAVQDFMREWGCDEDSAWARPRLEDKLPPLLHQQYIQGQYAMLHSPYARAYHYLHGRGLANAEGRGKGNGFLEFVSSKGAPFDNECWVEAESVETLGGLQQRLLELGEKVALRIG
jgi:hypothetical protein